MSNLKRSREFYAAVLPALGYKLVESGDAFAAFGPPGQPLFWLYAAGSPPGAIHIAFAAPDRAAIDRFHATALASGAQDNGRPALRPAYHPNYYGAFVLDPDGHNIEAVCHEPPGATR